MPSDHPRQSDQLPPRGNRLRAPYCWQEKTALRLIRDSLDGEASVATGLVVYLALCEVASDVQRDTFTATHLYLAAKCGLSARTVRYRLKDLSEVGLIHASTPKLKAPSTFTLLAVPQPSRDDRTPCPTDRQPLPNERQPLPSDRQRLNTATLPPLEECTEESYEESSEEVGQNDSAPPTEARRRTGRRAAGAAPTSTDADWLNGLKSDAAYRGIDVDREHGKMRNWCRVNHKQPTRRRFINWLNRADRPLTPTAPAAGGQQQPRFQTGIIDPSTI